MVLFILFCDQISYVCYLLHINPILIEDADMGKKGQRAKISRMPWVITFKNACIVHDGIKMLKFPQYYTEKWHFILNMRTRQFMHILDLYLEKAR